MEMYEEWDVTLPTLPSRNRLYHLEPIGVGTPYVESLTSYVSRLAGAHCVTLKALVTGVILPFQGKVDASLTYYFRLNKLWYESGALNGGGLIADEWVETLQALTGVQQLRFLTMSTFREVIAVNRLLRLSKTWCPQCYEGWQSHQQVVYEPLFWSLSSIEVCPCHQQFLVTQCPGCSKSIPFLRQTTRPGYCPYCGSFLGNVPKLFERDEKADMKWQCWKATVTGDLLAVAPRLLTPLLREQMTRRLKALVDEYAAGNISAWARFLGMTAQGFWAYLSRDNVPYFPTFLKMCYACSLTPVEFLTTSLLPSPSPEIPRFSVESLPVVSRGKWKPVTEEDVQRMRQALEAVIAVDYQADQFPNLTEIANRMGFNVATVRKHCPDLSQAITLRHKRHWSKEGERAKLKQALEMGLVKPTPEPLEEIARQLHCDTTTLRKHFPELCRAIVTRYRERIDYARIKQRLQEALVSEEILSVYALIRELGYPHHVVTDNFPELCRQISARWKAERKKRHQERMAAVGEKIHHIVLQLHEQNMYPTAGKVTKMLGDQHALRSKEGEDAWLFALQELGYQTDKFRKYE